MSAAAAEPPARVDLARAPDFEIAGVRVSPSACRVHVAGREARLEPLVVAVLVVLAKAANRTVTRDQLIDACWAGRIVSEDAITRTIAKVRAITRDVDPPPFTVETLPKVGFRLTEIPAPVAPGGGVGDRRRIRWIAAGRYGRRDLGE